jgi:hypothetical protein
MILPRRLQSPTGWAVVVAALASGCSKRDDGSATQDASPSKPIASQANPWFDEIAKQAGLTFRYESGQRPGQFLFPEIVGGGAGLLDYDNDGWLDIYCVQGGSLHPDSLLKPGNKLFRNLGAWRFEDVTERARVPGTGYGMGCACADFDHDGDTDIFVTNVGSNLLYRNNGDGTFTDVTREAGVQGGAWGTSCAFVDYDKDGYLDLIIANYVKWSLDQEIECFSRGGARDYCSPMSYNNPAMATLYRNLGNGTFEDVTLKAGLSKAYGNGLGIATGDFDQNGWPDIYVANDAMPNQLWLNQGDGSFKDEAMLRGCAVSALGVPEAGMGVVAVDVLQRGWLDLFVTHLVGEQNRLFLNTNGLFLDWVQPKGPGVPSSPFTGFGTGFFDFDQDGLLDLYVANGRVKLGAKDYDAKDPYAEPSQLLKGLGKGEFEKVPQSGMNVSLIATSRGCAFGDLDNDGDIDIVVINRDGPLHLLRNLAGSSRGNWITFRLQPRQGAESHNAMLQIEYGNSKQWRQCQPNEGYCSSNDPRVHFGLGSVARVDRLEVRWPNGEAQAFGPFNANKAYEIRQEKGGL